MLPVCTFKTVHRIFRRTFFLHSQPHITIDEKSPEQTTWIMCSMLTFAKIMQTCSESTERKDKRNKATTLPTHWWEKVPFADLLHISRHYRCRSCSNRNNQNVSNFSPPKKSVRIWCQWRHWMSSSIKIVTPCAHKIWIKSNGREKEKSEINREILM